MIRRCLQAFNLRVVDDAHLAWKWSSMRFIALGGAAQSAVLTSDRTGLSTHVPDWMLSGLSGFALVCIVLAGAGRLTTTEKSGG